MTDTRLILTAIADATDSEVLPDSDQWEYRLQVRSETSNRLYVVSRNIKTKQWGCSCPGWRTHRTCKHLDAMNTHLRRLT